MNAHECRCTSSTGRWRWSLHPSHPLLPLHPLHPLHPPPADGAGRYTRHLRYLRYIRYIRHVRYILHRQTALSMVYANHKELGCRYPETIEKSVGLQTAGHTGMLVEGELRAAEAARQA